MAEARRRLRLFLLAAALSATGCSAPEPIDTHREQLRDRLRGSLGERYDAPLPAVTGDAIQRGARLYDLLCSACHGATGKGNGKSARLLPIQPPDLSDPATAAFFSDRAKLQIIAEGADETPMIGWSDMLEEQERIAVLQFMNTLIREAASP